MRIKRALLAGHYAFSEKASLELEGVMIYTKGKWVQEAGIETYYFLISSKKAGRASQSTKKLACRCEERSDEATPFSCRRLLPFAALWAGCSQKALARKDMFLPDRKARSAVELLEMTCQMTCSKCG